MKSPFLSFSIVFILLALLILIRQRKGKPLTRIERTVLIVGLIAGIVDLIAGLMYIFSVLLPNYPWSEALAQIPIEPIIWIFSIVLAASIVTKTILHYKKPIEVSIKEHYRKRLEKEIGLELEKEVTIKNITLAPKEKDEVLELLTIRVYSDIMDGQLPAYDVSKVSNPPNSMKLVHLIFTISQDSAEILSKKMTELYNNRRYKKRLYRYSSLFI
jgi:hypothetical protein